MDKGKQPEIKKCPFCAEEIESNAVKCKFCDSFLETNKQENTNVNGVADKLGDGAPTLPERSGKQVASEKPVKGLAYDEAYDKANNIISVADRVRDLALNIDGLVTYIGGDTIRVDYDIVKFNRVGFKSRFMLKRKAKDLFNW